jgi:2-phosphoglycerate kinase
MRSNGAIPLPKVVLIGGAPCVGKSMVARRLASRHQYGCISTDDIGKAIRAHGSTAGLAELDPMTGLDWREYFANTPVDVLLAHDLASRKRVWPALQVIIETHASWGDPIVLEGYALWPEQVISSGFASTGALWLSCDKRLLQSRVRSDEEFYRGAADEEALIENFTRRSNRYNELMLESARDCGATVISVDSSQSVEEIADACTIALASASS